MYTSIVEWIWSKVWCQLAFDLMDPECETGGRTQNTFLTGCSAPQPVFVIVHHSPVERESTDGNARVSLEANRSVVTVGCHGNGKRVATVTPDEL